jgi:hypothetical protein
MRNLATMSDPFVSNFPTASLTCRYVIQSTGSPTDGAAREFKGSLTVAAVSDRRIIRSPVSPGY